MGVTVIKKEGGSSGGLTAPVNATDVADGSVSNTEFQYLNGVTSNIQTQIDGAGGVWDGEIVLGTTYSVTNDTTPGLPSPLIFDPYNLSGGVGKYVLEIIAYADNNNNGAPGFDLSISHADNYPSNFCSYGYIRAIEMKGSSLKGTSFINSSMNALTLYSNTTVAIAQNVGCFIIFVEAEFLNSSHKMTISVRQRVSSGTPVYLRAGSVIRYRKIA